MGYISIFSVPTCLNTGSFKAGHVSPFQACCSTLCLGRAHFHLLSTAMVIRDKFGMCWDPADRELAWALLREFVVSFESSCPFLRSGCRHSAEGWRQLLVGSNTLIWEWKSTSFWEVLPWLFSGTHISIKLQSILHCIISITPHSCAQVLPSSQIPRQQLFHPGQQHLLQPRRSTTYLTQPSRFPGRSCPTLETRCISHYLPELQAKAASLAHELHQGISRIRKLSRWPSMDSQVEN